MFLDLIQAGDQLLTAFEMTPKKKVIDKRKQNDLETVWKLIYTVSSKALISSAEIC